MRRPRPRLCLPTLAIFLVRCGRAGDAVPDATVGTTPDVVEVAPDASTAPVELGSGRDDWFPLMPAGSHVLLIHGPQGGYHVYGRVRLRGFQPDVRLAYRVLPAEGGPDLTDAGDVFHHWERNGLVHISDRYESAAADLVIMPPLMARGPAEFVGRPYRFEVTVTETATGRTATAEREIVIDYPGP